MSNLYKDAYDAASVWSSNNDWGGLFDWIDGPYQSNGGGRGIVDTQNIDPKTLLPYPTVDPSTNNAFTSAQNWVAPRRDPLVLDLDGGGIATSGINANTPILFDQNGDGIQTATGWIGSGEAILVRDLDGNGSIDSGRELFGDNTILTHGDRAGQAAANGFEALADLDADASGVADGKFDSNDLAFSSVRLWKDMNQDGISQASELFTLADLGVASIGVTGTATNVNLGGGNTQNFSGSFTRTDGQTGSSGALLLAANNFYRQFTDDPVVTADAQASPQMTGSGAVRDLRQAMSLGTAQALDLQAKVTQFAADTTKAQQEAGLDALIQSWGATSAMQTSIQTNRTLANPAAGEGSITAIEQFAQNNPSLYAQITALEQFNGSTILARWVQASGSTNVVSYSAEQETLIHQAYDALKASVYGALVVQTRLELYLDSIALVIDETGVRFDASATIVMAQGKAATDVYNAVGDLIDLQKYAGETVRAVGWEPYQTLVGVLETATFTTELQSLLAAERIVSLGATGTNYAVANADGWTVGGNAGANTLTGASGNDQLYGLGGNDTITDSGGSDTIDGGAGDDAITDQGNGTNVLRGGEGNDTVTFSYYASNTVEGGAGDDLLKVNDNQYGYSAYAHTLAGGAGTDRMQSGGSADTYLFNRGDGQDTVNDYGYSGNGWAVGADKLVFGAGIAAAESVNSDQLWFRQVGNNLEVSVIGTSEAVTIENWYSGSLYHIEQFKTSDGKTLLDSQVQNLVQAMADFAPPAAGQMTLPESYASSLTPVIAANWQ